MYKCIENSNRIARLPRVLSCFYFQVELRKIWAGLWGKLAYVEQQATDQQASSHYKLACTGRQAIDRHKLAYIDRQASGPIQASSRSRLATYIVAGDLEHKPILGPDTATHSRLPHRPPTTPCRPIGAEKHATAFHPPSGDKRYKIQPVKSIQYNCNYSTQSM